MLFFKYKKQKLFEQETIIQLRFNNQIIKFYKKTYKQLIIQLDNYQNFDFYFKKKVEIN